MATTQNEKPLYLGHRERLRERFLKDGGNSMADYELLEMLLMLAIPRRDVKPLAKKLIIDYGDIASVINAPAIKLKNTNKLSDSTISALKLVAECSKRCVGVNFFGRDQDIISTWEQFLDYARQLLAFEEIEKFMIFMLDSAHHLKGYQTLSVGTINMTSVHPREIIRAAIENKAVKVILAHNHPAGIAKPSQADINLTDFICEAADTMDIEIYDHIIVTRNEIFSFRNKGLITGKTEAEKKTREKLLQLNEAN